MIGSDISLTLLLIFDLCTNYETGPSSVCRSNQSVHKRLKIIHLNFQNMEHNSVHLNSVQLFERSDVVHVVSLQPQELLYCQEHFFHPGVFTFKKAHFPQNPSLFPHMTFQSLGYVMIRAAALRVCPPSVLG